MLRLFWFVFVLILVGAPTAVYRQWIDVPPEWNPWAPLDIQAPPNVLTPIKRWRIQGDRALCEQALATSTLRFESVRDRVPAAGCPIENAVRVSGSSVTFNSSFVATCPLAMAYAMFEVHGMQPIAQRIYGQPVARVDHFGSFSCRNIANSARRSQHATANAFDIAGFRLQDGTRITLARDWKGDDRDARFLREVRDAACTYFNTVLGPEYNAAHRDHFHLDMGRARICR
ncbi:extensin-like domain-containing protein [Pseudomonas matsuisoli]|uniref:Extensin-like C-terminal domain-containing protein n=1 Tax=Pseudomonas matsuisoli TaxID=1515666 RepID=A0A917USH4_9PSED|nr:extensin family protein [Pseudomonas matsuisoli]GGJ82034.1 hypothetical protein GCM10009304_05020 [Pseudomonas matsuisoli]